MERRFACTACGKCCYGWLPLTLADALAHAGRFPLAIIWTPVRQASKAFDMTSRLGTTMRLPNRKTVAVRIVPTAYSPPAFACPELTSENLCGIHEGKPLRCRTMPFFPFRDEADQADLLIPRPGWTCDTSDVAPVVYRDKHIVDRADFDAERKELVRQSMQLRVHADSVLATSPSLMASISKVVAKGTDGHVVTSFASLMPRLAKGAVANFAEQQYPVLEAYAAKTAGDPALAEYHRHYTDWLTEVERIRTAVRAQA